MTLVLQNLNPRAIALLRNAASDLGLEDVDGVIAQKSIAEAMLDCLSNEELKEVRTACRER